MFRNQHWQPLLSQISWMGAVAMVSLVVGFVSAQDPIPDQVTAARMHSPIDDSTSTDSKIASDDKPNEEMVRQREELFAFVRQNHPELLRLLRKLRENRPGQFQQALRTLQFEVNRLNHIKQRQPEERYQQALENWKIRSRIKLLAAQMAVDDAPQLDQRLRELVTQQYDNQLQQMIDERDGLQARLNRLDELIDATRNNRADVIDDRVDRIVGTAQRMTKKKGLKDASLDAPSENQKPKISVQPTDPSDHPQRSARD